MTRFITRLDDVGQACDQSQPDVGLQYLKKWLRQWGTVDEPLYLAAVPSFLGEEERNELRVLEAFSEAEIALHGYDHSRGPLTWAHLEVAQEVFPQATVVVPPYNEANRDTINAMAALGMKVLLGGFNGEHHRYGEAPCMVGKQVLHVSAHPALYARSYQLIDTVSTMEDPGYPLQVVLHHRWESMALGGVSKLHKALEGKMVSVEEAWP